MKKSIVVLVVGMLPFILIAQKIRFEKDPCSHCGMVIKEHRFAAIAQEHSGKLKKFDAIECLVNFLKGKSETAFNALLVADYSGKNDWVSAEDAIYLKSKQIPSPMGAYLSAYSSLETANKINIEHRGEVFTWNELLKQFKYSRFGLLDHPDHHQRPDAYAPIGVMGGHVHHKGSFMFGLSYMHMHMAGNLQGPSGVSEENIHQLYMSAPQRMNMDMYMLMAMYSPTDRITIMLMQPFIERQMDLTTRMGMNFQTESTGLGDTQLSLLYSLFSNEKISFHVNSGISLPQGEISKDYDTPMANDMKLPYQMQVGSGTVDLFLGLTYRQAFNNYSWGVQPLSIIRTGTNSEGYRQGYHHQITSWGSVNLNSSVSISLRIEGQKDTGIVGTDKDLNKMMSPAANPENYGSTRLRSFVGSNLAFPNDSFLKNIKVGLEYGIPLYQNVRGIQMRDKGTINAGIKYLL